MCFALLQSAVILKFHRAIFDLYHLIIQGIRIQKIWRFEYRPERDKTGELNV